MLFTTNTDVLSWQGNVAAGVQRMLCTCTCALLTHLPYLLVLLRCWRIQVRNGPFLVPPGADGAPQMGADDTSGREYECYLLMGCP